MLPAARQAKFRSMSTRIFARTVGATVLALFAAFCIFGFLAAFEPMPSPTVLWQVGYATVGCALLTGAVILFRPTPRTSATSMLASGALFSLLGFGESFLSSRAPGQAAYGAIGAVCLAALVGLLRSTRRARRASRLRRYLARRGYARL